MGRPRKTVRYSVSWRRKAHNFSSLSDCLNRRLSLLDVNSPQSPTPNLSRTHSFASAPISAQQLNGIAQSPPHSLLNPASSTPSKAQMTAASAMGENIWDSPAGNGDSRARRELSVIEEREASVPPKFDGVEASRHVIDLTGDDDTDQASDLVKAERGSLAEEPEMKSGEDDRPNVDQVEENESPGVGVEAAGSAILA